MNASTAVAVKNVEGSAKIDFVALFENALNTLKKEVEDAERVFDFALAQFGSKDQALELADKCENARATFLYEKVSNNNQHTMDEKSYYDVKNTIRNYSFPWIKKSAIKAAKRKIARLEKLDKSQLTQAQVLSIIKQVKHHIKEVSRYFYNNPQRLADKANTEAMITEFIINAFVHVKASQTSRLIEGVRSLNQDELMVNLLDGAKRLMIAINTAQSNLEEAHQTGPFVQCDIVAHNVGVLSARLNVLEFSGVEFNKKELLAMQQSINAVEDTALKLVRGSTIDGARDALSNVMGVISRNDQLTDETLLSFIWQMQVHREWLSYYKDVKQLLEDMQNLSMNVGYYAEGSVRHTDIYKFVDAHYKQAA